MILALILTILTTCSGMLLSYFYDHESSLAGRVCAGAVTGSALFGFISFWLALFIGFSFVSIAVTVVLLLVPFALLRRERFALAVKLDIAVARMALRKYIMRPALSQTAALAFLLFMFLLLLLCFDRAMIERGNAIYTGIANNYGDLPFHIGTINSFTEGNNFPPQDPSFAGATFAYPFIADFVVAVFVRCGMTMRAALLLHNMTMALALLGLVHGFAFRLTRDRLAAYLAQALFFLGAGVGWIMLFANDWKAQRGLSTLLWHLPHDYSIMPESVFRWGDALTTLLVTQRSLLLGLPLTIVVLNGLWRLFARNELNPAATSAGARARAGTLDQKPGRATQQRSQEQAVAGAITEDTRFMQPALVLPIAVFAGLLPLIHAHSFAVVIAVAGLLMLFDLKAWKPWTNFIGVALVVGTPQLLWMMHGGATGSVKLVGLQFGWDHGATNVLLFWLANTGVFVPLLIVALCWRARGRTAGPADWFAGVSRTALLFYVPFVCCFIGANVLRLAPWIWDNIKVLVYWYLVSVPFVALILAHMLRRGWLARACATVLLLSLCAAGALDSWRVVSRATELQVFDRAEVEAAAVIGASVPPNTLLLNAPTFNNVVFLTGRRSFLGYPGHVWSHGIDYRPRERMLQEIYAGSENALRLLQEQHIDYVVVGPQERDYANIGEGFWARFPVQAQVGQYVLYRVNASAPTVK